MNKREVSIFWTVLLEALILCSPVLLSIAYEEGRKFYEERKKKQKKPKIVKKPRKKIKK